MENLDIKYTQNSLTLEELADLRVQVSMLNDDSLGDRIEKVWEKDIIQSVQPAVSVWDSIRNGYNQKPQKTKHLWTWVSGVAVAVVICLLTTISIHFYSKNTSFEKQEILVATDRGERVNIELPDGTKVTLNSETQMRYSPGLFANGQRVVDFSGEAYFDVQNDGKTDFTVRNKDAIVRVLGTKFTFTAKDQDSTISLTLDQGLVEFKSVISGIIKNVSQGQYSVMNKYTGEIIVEDIGNGNLATWRKGELVFRNATLKDVVKIVGQH